jgi:hypothetical protein
MDWRDASLRSSLKLKHKNRRTQGVLRRVIREMDWREAPLSSALKLKHKNRRTQGVLRRVIREMDWRDAPLSSALKLKHKNRRTQAVLHRVIRTPPLFERNGTARLRSQPVACPSDGARRAQERGDICQC